ncbi:MAG: EamA family transporter [Spirochaeta sp.]|nr:EamA family transporter [Spirochaeta sp.]
MTALFLAILSSASLALIFRTTEARGYNRFVITAVNYLAAVATAGVLFVLDLLARQTVPVPPEPMTGAFGPALVIAVPGGVLFFLSFILYQRAVAEYGPGPAGMYGKLGILVPMVLSMVVWNELPTTIQWVGLAVALCAIVISQTGRGRRFGSPGGAHPVAVPRPLLIVLLLSMGFAEFSNKLFERFGDDRVRSLFLALLFGTALIAATVAAWRRNERPTAAELRWGVLVGVPNLFSSFFLIASLKTVPAAVAFPAFSAGSIGLIAVGARVIYQDRLTLRQWSAVGLTAVALVLINLR